MALPEVDVIFAQIEVLTESSKPSSKRRVSEREWTQFFDQFCQWYVRSNQDERVDLLIALEAHEAVLSQFVTYLDGLTRKAADHAARDRQLPGRKALENAIVADAVIDGRGNSQDLQRIHNQILETAERLRFEVDRFLYQFEISADDYVKRAQQHFKLQHRAKAIRTLGRALQLDPNLKKNERIVELASELTWEAPYSAIMILEDPFLRNRFVEEMGQVKRTSTAGEADMHQADKASSSLIKRLFTGRR